MNERELLDFFAFRAMTDITAALLPLEKQYPEKVLLEGLGVMVAGLASAAKKNGRHVSCVIDAVNRGFQMHDEKATQVFQCAPAHLKLAVFDPDTIQ